MSENNISKLEEIEKYLQNKRGEFITFFYRKNKKFPNGWGNVRDIVNYAKEKNNYKLHTFHTRALKKLVEKFSSKIIRYKFLKFGVIPKKNNFSKWLNGKVNIPQNLLFIVEILISKLLNKSEREELLKFDLLDNEPVKCDCESYNT